MKLKLEPDDTLCRHCDVFVGFGAIGVVKMPEGREYDWLADHCWLCGRPTAEVITENLLRRS